MVLPAWSGQVTPADAARAPRPDMIPGETLMAGYAYNDSLSRHPDTLQRTVEQLQVRLLCFSLSPHPVPATVACIPLHGLQSAIYWVDSLSKHLRAGVIFE
jgi:hypothetical protein